MHKANRLRFAWHARIKRARAQDVGTESPSDAVMLAETISAVPSERTKKPRPDWPGLP